MTLWDAASGKLIASFAHAVGFTNLPNSNPVVFRAAFSPDGARILTISTNNSAELLDATSGELVASFPHQDEVFQAEFSSDGARILTASGERSIFIRKPEIWYNTKLLEKNGIKVGNKMTFDEFFAACDKLKAACIPALGVGDSGIWASAELFENTLLGVIGPNGWNSRQVGIHPASTDKSLSNLAWRDLLSI